MLCWTYNITTARCDNMFSVRHERNTYTHGAQF